MDIPGRTKAFQAFRRNVVSFDVQCAWRLDRVPVAVTRLDNDLKSIMIGAVGAIVTARLSAQSDLPDGERLERMICRRSTSHSRSSCLKLLDQGFILGFQSIKIAL